MTVCSRDGSSSWSLSQFHSILATTFQTVRIPDSRKRYLTNSTYPSRWTETFFKNHRIILTSYLRIEADDDGAFPIFQSCRQSPSFIYHKTTVLPSTTTNMQRQNPIQIQFNLLEGTSFTVLLSSTFEKTGMGGRASAEDFENKHNLILRR
jgi:hypothetical protein